MLPSAGYGEEQWGCTIPSELHSLLPSSVPSSSVTISESSGAIALVTGPARSGKSAFAEQLATQSGYPVTYVATALPNPADAEWQARLARHRDRRPAEWHVLEIPHDLPAAIAAALPQNCYLIDSLGTWAANWIEASESDWREQVEQLLAAIARTPASTVWVAEEVGWGVVPAYELGRRFRDRLGLLCQRVGAIADAVYLVTAGYALNVKELGQAISIEDNG